MALPHAKSAEVIDITPLGAALDAAQTKTLIKTNHLELIRLVLPAGRKIKRHSVPGEITVQCLEGHVVLSTEVEKSEMVAGNLVYLSGADEHALLAVEDSSLLVTILLQHKHPARNTQADATSTRRSVL